MKKEGKKIIDISLTIKPGMMVYPGNPEIEFDNASSQTSELTKMTLGSHTGTHLDAPRHSKVSDAGIDLWPVETFICPARVIDATNETEYVSQETVVNADPKSGERLLFKTKNSKLGYAKWRSDYIYLHGDAAEELARREIALFGLDWISVKQKGGSDNRCHTALLEKQIPILEGLDLSSVEPGEYELIFLPLKLGSLDGGIGRAILRK
jgi:arylformamidase